MGTRPAAVGGRYRAAAGLMAAARIVRAPETAQMLALFAELAVLADTLARLRAEQNRATQCTAARHAPS